MDEQHSLRILEGDLFSSAAFALAHGCNAAGVMGSGIAVQFRERYEKMYKQYRQACLSGELEGGDVFIYSTGEHCPKVIYNCITQIKPGPNAELSLIEESFIRMLLDMKARHLDEVAIPLIGCGIGGLKWPDVRASIFNALDYVGFDILVTVRVLPGTVLQEDGS